MDDDHRRRGSWEKVIREGPSLGLIIPRSVQEIYQKVAQPSTATTSRLQQGEAITQRQHVLVREGI